VACSTKQQICKYITCVTTMAEAIKHCCTVLPLNSRSCTG